MSSIIPEAAHAGKFGLRVVDTSDTIGSSCRSALMASLSLRMLLWLSGSTRTWSRLNALSSAWALKQSVEPRSNS